MIKRVNNQDWFCCPKCGKKLFPIQPGAVCRGLMAKCRGKLENGKQCDWQGEIKIF